MNKIKELLKDKNSILVFDIDGVLALLEFGEYNHYHLVSDDEWNDACENNNFYTEDKVSKRMQDFISTRDISNVYVISRVCNEPEIKHKIDYVKKYYGILEDHVYCVLNENSKLKEFENIRNKYKDKEDKQIIMIDDSTPVLTEIQEKTGCSTAHISSFLDL